MGDSNSSRSSEYDEQKATMEKCVVSCDEASSSVSLQSKTQKTRIPNKRFVLCASPPSERM